MSQGTKAKNSLGAGQQIALVTKELIFYALIFFFEK